MERDIRFRLPEQQSAVSVLATPPRPRQNPFGASHGEMDSSSVALAMSSPLTGKYGLRFAPARPQSSSSLVQSGSHASGTESRKREERRDSPPKSGGDEQGQVGPTNPSDSDGKESNDGDKVKTTTSLSDAEKLHRSKIDRDTLENKPMPRRNRSSKFGERKAHRQVPVAPPMNYIDPSVLSMQRRPSYDSPLSVRSSRQPQMAHSQLKPTASLPNTDRRLKTPSPSQDGSNAFEDRNQNRKGSLTSRRYFPFFFLFPNKR